MVTHEDPPPSYETLLAELSSRLGPNPTVETILNAIHDFPPSYKQLEQQQQQQQQQQQYSGVGITASLGAPRPGDDLPVMTEEQKKLFTIGVAKTMSSKEALAHLETSAAEAVKAVNVVETMFLNLTAALGKIDSRNTPPAEGAFGPRLQVIHTEFRGTLVDSRTLATKIATYGERFDKVIIPICKDPNLSTDQRRAKVEAFIKDSDTFASDAKTMTERFDKLKSTFSVFTGSFGGWAKDKEEADTATLKQARLDLDDLNAELTRLTIAMYAMAGATVLALPVTGTLALMSGPFAPFVIAGGLIFAGLALAATLALYAAIQSEKGKISDKEKEISDLEASIAELKQTRGDLEKLGKTDLKALSDSINVISLLWTSVKNDAVKISEWLTQGAHDADMPPYMLVSVNQAVTIYQNMAVYLNNYANGIENVPAS